MTKVTLVTSVKPLHKSCVNCKRPNGTTFKCCERCRERARKRMQKRLNATPVCPPGQRYCTCCGHIKPEDQFKSSVARRQTLTKLCQTCRQSKARSEINPTTAVGKCRARWEEWKAKNPCVVCGESDPQLIEADHLRDKVYRCSDDRYWSCHGGVPALEREFAKCQSLCRWCHRLKTKRERGTEKKKSILERRAIINAEKLRRGKCLRCPRRVTLETCCAFDFDHRDPSTKVIRLANLIRKSQAFFDQHIKSELKACDLLCCNCHKKERVRAMTHVTTENMNHSIHFSQRFLKASESEYKDIDALNQCTKHPAYSVNAFLPIEKIEDSEDTDRVLIYFKEEHVSLLDMSHTLAYLESTIDGVNVLTRRRLFERVPWSVTAKKDMIIVNMPRYYLRLIQYGYSCSIAVRARTSGAARLSVRYPWIARAWMDEDDTIFTYGVTSLLTIINPRIKTDLRCITHGAISIIRRIPELLKKFGNVGKRFVWEDMFQEHYLSETNPFMQSLIAMLYPPVDSGALQITKDGVIMLNNPRLPSIFHSFFDTHMAYKNKYCDDRFLFNCGQGYMETYMAFYEMILSDAISPSRALKLFMSVTRHSAGTSGMKTPLCIKKVLTTVPICRKRKRSDTDSVGSRYREMYQKLYGVARLPNDDIYHLAKLILWIEIRCDYMAREYRTQTVADFCWRSTSDYYFECIEDILRKQTTFYPVLRLPRHLIKQTPATVAIASEAFPVMLFREDMHETVDKIVGDKLHNYFKVYL